MSPTFDPTWEARYRDNPGYRNHYPWSHVVTFIFRHAPRDRPRGAVRILEVGCGNGANLWFAAREGFSVAGVDASDTAINYAREWFAREGLTGDLRVGDFTSLPFNSATFDMVIDRSALSFVPVSEIQAAIGEIRRVLVPGGQLSFNPLSDRCTSFDGAPDPDGCYRHVTRGTIAPGSQVAFLGVADIRRLFADGWTIRRLLHGQETDLASTERTVHAEWYVEAVKRDDDA